jgi:hypothetical protein
MRKILRDVAIGCLGSLLAAGVWELLAYML